MNSKQKWLLLTAGAGLVFLGRNRARVGKTAEVGKLNNLTPADFGEWWPFMSAELVKRLDVLIGEARKYGYTVIISPALGSIGRVTDGSNSRHNVTKWGEVQAVDLMVYTDFAGEKSNLSAGQASLFISDIKAAGFGGVGVYPNWKPYAGFHVDVRPRKTDGSMATWSDIGNSGKHQYVAMRAGLDMWGLA